MLLKVYWTNCFCLHIASNNLSAKKRRKFTARNASLYHSLYVWENHKYFNNKVQVSMRTWKNKTLLRELSPTQILQHFKEFRLSFSETIPIFFIHIKKWFYPCVIAIKFLPLNDFGLNSRDKLLNKKSSKWLKLILCCLISYFAAGKFWWIFFNVILKTKLLSHHL